MRLLISASLPYGSTLGGAEVYVELLAKAALAFGHEVAIASLSLRVGDYPTGQSVMTSSDGVTNIQANVGVRSRTAQMSPELTPECQQAVRSIVSWYQPDVLHSNGYHAAFANACAALGVPFVATVHDAGAVCPAGTLLDWRDRICGLPIERATCGSCMMRRLPGNKLIGPLVGALPPVLIAGLHDWLSTRGNVPFVTPFLQAGTEPLRTQACLAELSRPGVRLIAPSGALVRALVAHGVSPTQITLLPHGVEEQRSTPAPHNGVRPVRFVYVGRISHAKGLHVLMKAFSGLTNPHWELHIVGEPGNKYERRYFAGVRRIPVDWSKVMLHGWVNREHVSQLVAQSDVLVFPSLLLESFGLVVAEARSLGRPTIATRCGGPEDQIRDDLDGILVEPGSVEALATALNRVIADPIMISRMAANLRRGMTIGEHFARIQMIYDSIASVPSPH
jgi:glycosyltransferase involved in cell wall biosynthesis